jgi:WD40 repeat protein
MTGELRLELEASQKAFGAPAAAIACDGHRVAFSSGLNNEVWLVDLDSGDLEGRAFCAEDAIISHLCVLNAQRCVLAGHQNGSLILWQLTEGGGDAHYVWREQDAHSGDLAFLAVLPGERWCVSAGEDGAVRLWDLVRRRCHRVLCKEREAIRSMAVSDDGRRLAVGCRQCVSIWQMRYTADSVHPVQWKAEPMLVRPWASRALVEEQSRYGLAVGAAEKALAEGKWAEAHADFRRALDVPGHERDRRVLGGIARAGVYGKRRGLREVWLASRFRCSRIFRDSGRARLLFSHPHPWVVRFAPDDSRMACGCRDASVQIWDVAGGRKRVSLEHNAAVLSMAWSRDGKSVMCGDGAGEIRVWDATEGRDVLGTLRCQTAWRAHTKSVTGLDVSLMGDRLVSAGGDGAVRVWDLSDRRCVAAFEHPGVEVVGCLSDGRRAVSAGAGGRVRVWDLQVGACLADFGAGSEHEVRALCEVPGLEAVLVAQECDFALLRLDGSGCLGRLRVHSSYVTALDVTPDSRWATSVSWDGQLKVWDLRTFTCSQALDSHRGRLFALGMSHDGRYAASGGDDSMLRLWEFDWEWEFELTNGLEREPLL